MIRKCLDEGTLQSYLDGELSPSVMNETAAHIASCGVCAAAAREAGGEMILFAGAFAPEQSVQVPTDRLRERLAQTIGELQPSAPRAATFANSQSSLREWLAALVAPLMLTPSRAAGFAGLAAVVLFGVTFALLYAPNQQRKFNEVAENQPLPTVGTEGLTASAKSPRGTQTADPESSDAAAPSELTPKILKAGVPPPKPRPSHRVKTPAGDDVKKSPKFLPGEESYLNAIASLSKVVEASGDAVLRPNVRADFERNMAEFDQAIAATRRNALRNPKDRDAVNFLFSAYQSKVELLSAVADRAQVAAIGR
ncbi:MAG: hypothetical protein ACRD68_01305 [Pyrinomonadaceae bacterium]